MSVTTLVEKALLGLEFGGTAYTPPPTNTVGLMTASVWTASTAYTVGQCVMESVAAFNGGSGTVGRIFRCTTAGTSGSSAPSWNAAAGATTTDGGVTWTEIQPSLEAGTVTSLAGLEPTGGGYARPTMTNNTSNWTLAGPGNPASVSNTNALAFGTTTASWNYIVGGLIYDATPTNLHNYGFLGAASAIATVPGVAISIPAADFLTTLA